MNFSWLAKKKPSSKATKIIFKNKNFLLENKQLSTYSNQPYSKLYAMLDFSECITDIIEISKNIPKEDLADTIELKVYEELSLDPTQNYIIRFQHHSSDDENGTNKYFVFVAKEYEVANKFKTKPIDFIAYSPLVISALFQNSILPNTNDYAFVYLDDNDAFIAIYSKGDFLYCKGSQKLSIAYLLNKFCEIAGERISQSDFLDYFLNNRLKLDRFDSTDTKTQFWTQFFTTISEILQHAKRTYKIDEYSAIYIGSSSGTLVDIENLSKDYVNAKILPFDFNILNSFNGDILTKLLCLYVDSENALDFSIFHRPPPLLWRDGGKFAVISAFSVSLFVLYPAVMFGPYEAYLLYKANSLDDYYASISTEKTTYEAKISALNSVVMQDKKLLSSLNKEFDGSINILQDLANIKTRYTPKSIIMVDIANIANVADVRLDRLDFNETNATLICASSDSGNIAKFINLLKEKYKTPPISPNMQNDGGSYKAEIIVTNIGIMP